MSHATPHAPAGTDASIDAAAALGTGQPSRALQIGNFIVFQLAWFAAVIGAAHRIPLWGTACVGAALAWHLGLATRPAQEARLIGCACLIGFVVESAMVSTGWVQYPSGQPFARIAPYWIVALWGLFAIALNVTLRWLKHRAWLAAVLGAVAGPISFASGVRLGGARFLDAPSALLAIGAIWAVAMPVLMALSNRFDGIRVPPPTD